MAGADGQAGGEEGFVVVVVAGAVDRELPLAGGADIAEPAQLERGGVGQRRIDVAEGPAVADLQAGDLRPAFAGPGAQPLLQRRLGGVRVLGHGGLLPRALGGHWRAGDWRGHGIKLGTIHVLERMPVQSPYQIVLSGQEQAVLAARARSARGPYRDRLRASIVLAAAVGQANATIAAQMGVCTNTVRKWRRRFAEGGLAGLKDAPRSGRPPAFTAADRAEVVALACALPAESGVPLSKWSGPDLARELAARRGLTVSASTIRRWLARDVLKPWQHRSWISVRDPAFAARAARVLDLYAGTWDGRPLGAREYVICADEKTSIQARCRCHPTLPPGKARAMRVEHDYDRGGALAYLAAWDRRRRVFNLLCKRGTGDPSVTGVALAERTL